MPKYIDTDELIRALEFYCIPEAVHFVETAKEVSMWISVKEALPERFLNVLVTDGEIVSIGAWQHGKSWCVEDFDIEGRNIKYWQPIPEPPGKKQ